MTKVEKLQAEVSKEEARNKLVGQVGTYEFAPGASIPVRILAVALQVYGNDMVIVEPINGCYHGTCPGGHGSFKVALRKIQLDTEVTK